MVASFSPVCTTRKSVMSLLRVVDTTISFASTDQRSVASSKSGMPWDLVWHGSALLGYRSPEASSF